jgi:hypothetical protein
MRQKAVEDYEALDMPGMSLEEYVQRQLAHDGTRQAAFSRHHFSYHYPLVRDFFRNYVLNQSLEHIPEDVEVFMAAKDRDKKLYMGRTLLTEAVRVATDRVDDRYKQMYAKGSLHPAMPRDVVELVLDKLGSQQQRDRLILRQGHAFAAQTAA